MDGHWSRIFGLAFHPYDSRVLVSAGWDDTVQVCTCTYVYDSVYDQYTLS